MGYVGLPLAIEFATKINVVGYDINNTRIENLKKNFDETNEVLKDIEKSKKIIIFIQKLKI